MEAPDYGAAKGIDCVASVSPMERAESVFKEREKQAKGIKWRFLSLFVINWKSHKEPCRFYPE